MRSQVGEVSPWPIDVETQSRDLKSTRIPYQKILEKSARFKRKDVLGVKLLEKATKVKSSQVESVFTVYSIYFRYLYLIHTLL